MLTYQSQIFLDMHIQQNQKLNQYYVFNVVTKQTVILNLIKSLFKWGLFTLHNCSVSNACLLNNLKSHNLNQSSRASIFHSLMEFLHYSTF